MRVLAWAVAGIAAALLAAVPGAAAPARPTLLVVTETAGYRHASIAAGLGELRRLQDREGVTVREVPRFADLTPEDYAGAKGIVLLQTSGTPELDAAGRARLLAAVRGGLPLLAFHAATSTFPAWTAFHRMVGASFRDHPNVGLGRVRVERRDHPATAALRELPPARGVVPLPRQPGPAAHRARPGLARRRERRRAPARLAAPGLVAHGGAGSGLRQRPRPRLRDVAGSAPPRAAARRARLGPGPYAVAMGHTALVLGDQLMRDNPALEGADRVLLIESTGGMKRLRTHRRRVHLVLSGMRHLAAELRDAGEVEVVERRAASSLKAGLEGFDDVVCAAPNTFKARQGLERLGVRLVASNQFLTDPEAFATWAGDRKRLVMEDFYREQRRRFEVLLDAGRQARGRALELRQGEPQAADEGPRGPRPLAAAGGRDRRGGARGHRRARPRALRRRRPAPVRGDPGRGAAGARRLRAGAAPALRPVPGRDGRGGALPLPRAAQRAAEPRGARAAGGRPRRRGAPTATATRRCRASRASSGRSSAGASGCGGCTGCGPSSGRSATRSTRTSRSGEAYWGGRTSWNCLDAVVGGVEARATPTTSSGSWSSGRSG